MLAKGLSDIANMRKEKAAKDALSSLYRIPEAQAQSMSGPESGVISRQPVANDYFTIASQFPDTEVGKRALTIGDRLYKAETKKADRIFQSGQTDKTIKANKETAELRLLPKKQKRAATIEGIRQVSPALAKSVESGKIDADTASDISQDPRRLTAYANAQNPNISKAEKENFMKTAFSKEPAKLYEGTGQEQQDIAILMQANNNPEFAGTREYAQAFNRMSASKQYLDQKTGAMTTITPDMSAYLKPTFNPNSSASPAANSAANAGGGEVALTSNQAGVDIVDESAGGENPLTPEVVKREIPSGETVTQIKANRPLQLSAETQSRISLMLSQIPKMKEVVRQIEGGAFDGMQNRLFAAMNKGKPGELISEINALSEGLNRMMTGAGMNMGEVAKEQRLYGFRWYLDSKEDVIRKIRQLVERTSDVVAINQKGLDRKASPEEVAAEIRKSRPDWVKAGMEEQDAEVPAPPSGAILVN